MDDELLAVLCCPLTRQTLRIAEPAELAKAGERVSRRISEGLVREDGKVLYPVRNGIPLLVPEEAIPI